MALMLNPPPTSGVCTWMRSSGMSKMRASTRRCSCTPWEQVRSWNDSSSGTQLATRERGSIGLIMAGVGLSLAQNGIFPGPARAAAGIGLVLVIRRAHLALRAFLELDLVDILLEILMVAMDLGLRQQRPHLEDRDDRQEPHEQVDQRKEEPDRSDEHRPVKHRRRVHGPG